MGGLVSNKSLFSDLKITKIKMFNKFKLHSEFSRNVLTLVSGSAVSQIIVLLASPILTRIFTPSDFGSSALFLSICSILIVIITGRYEMAIVQTKKNYDAISLMIISLSLALLSSILIYIFYIFFKQSSFFINLNKQLDGFILLIPLFIFVLVAHKVLTNYMNRNKYYKLIALNQISQSFSQVSFKLIYGFLLVPTNGIILGNFIGQAIALFLFIYRFLMTKVKRAVYYIAIKRIRYNLKYFKEFPKILLFSDLVNVIAIQLPFLLTSYYYSNTQLGYLSLAYAMSSAPLAFIGTSLSRVFRQQSASDYNKLGRCDILFTKMFKKLVIYLTLPFIILFFSAPYLFEIVFGNQWAESGKMVQILIVMFYFQFFARIFNYLYILTNHQKANFKIQLVLLVGTYLSFSIGYLLFQNISFSLLFFSVIYTLIYIYTIYKSYIYSKGY